MHYFDRLIESQMQHYRFGDKRLDARCRFSQLSILSAGSNRSFPQIFKDQYSLKGLYRFANNKRVHPAAFGEAYRRGLYDQACLVPKAERPTRYFVFQDSSTAKYNGRGVELGYIETGKDNGVLLHHGILTDDKFVPLGLPVQQFITRQRSEYGKSKERGKRPFEEKESHKWVEGFDFGRAFRRKTGIEVVQVMDKESDIAAVFNYALRHTHCFFIINAWHDRKIQDSEVKLLEHMRQMPQHEVVKRTILAENGKKHRLDCALCYERLNLEGVDKPLYAVYLKQLEAIEGQEPAEWVLLTNLEVHTLQDAEQITDAYAHRWRTCEDFHKCLKTGCSIEKRQLDSQSALFNVIALLSLPAIALLRLRHLAETQAGYPVEEMLSEDQIRVAEIAAERYLMPIDHTFCQKKTVLWIVLLLGRMGGHQGFKQKGLPGWQTIWAGWNYLQALVDGYNMSKNIIHLQKPPTCG